MPMLAIYEKHIKRCEDCLDEFSGPWSDVCKKCYDIANSDIKLVEGRVVRTPYENVSPYRGWPWAAQSERERRADVHRRHLSYLKAAPEIEIA